MIFAVIGTVSIVFALVATVIFVGSLTEELDEKEQKIEALQQENSQLNDDIWNLNQELMKEVRK